MKHLFSLNIITLVMFKELQGDGLVYGAPLYIMIVGVMSVVGGV